ncbi:hypothetical protein PUN28_005582 [Cardiocondyla obscurior]|uniref:NADP-dependent oxidoreductase domain-containing protein n=1 Tax=Cardiocondyla obscurior TaxID=286306 RepID=A0AAW2GI96_9HYME
MIQVSSVILPTGQAMPMLGFGTWNAAGEELEAALDTALEIGYRLIDTATVYGNERIIGNVLKKWFDSGRIERSDLFIVTKVPPSGNRPGDIEKWLERSLSNLQLSYLDLYLIHTPFAYGDVEGELHPFNEKGEIIIDPDTDHLAIWSVMEKQVMEGRTKAIGLSNFNVAQIERILNHATLPVSNLQVEMHVYLQQSELLKFCQDHDISVTAYSPLGSRGFVENVIFKGDAVPKSLEDLTVQEIARKYEKSPAQILLKHIIQKGVIAIPKSTNSSRIKENFDLFDWELEAEDVEKLNDLDKGESGRICDFKFFKGLEKHPEFPF